MASTPLEDTWQLWPAWNKGTMDLASIHTCTTKYWWVGTREDPRGSQKIFIAPKDNIETIGYHPGIKSASRPRVASHCAVLTTTDVCDECALPVPGEPQCYRVAPQLLSTATGSRPNILCEIDLTFERDHRGGFLVYKVAPTGKGSLLHTMVAALTIRYPSVECSN